MYRILRLFTVMILILSAFSVSAQEREIYDVVVVDDGAIVESGTVSFSSGEVFEVRVVLDDQSEDITANLTVDGEEYFTQDGGAACRSDQGRFIGWDAGEEGQVAARIPCTMPTDIKNDQEIGLVGYQFRNCPEGEESCSRTESEVKLAISGESRNEAETDESVGERILKEIINDIFGNGSGGSSNGGSDNDQGSGGGDGNGDDNDDGDSEPVPVGEPADGTADIGRISNEFATKAIARCPGGTVNTSTRSCLNQISVTAVPAGIMNSALQFASGTVPVRGGVYQCVAFVQTVLPLYHRDMSYSAPRGIAATMWFNDGNQPPGYIKIHKDQGVPMQPGDIPIWGYGTYGHIAVTIAVRNVKGATGTTTTRSFTIAEGNVDGAGTVSNTRELPISDPGLIGWIRYTGN